MLKRTQVQVNSCDTQKSAQTIAHFLEGIYYAGNLPSHAECREITQYLRSRNLVNGTQGEVEALVTEAMVNMHREINERLAQ